MSVVPGTRLAVCAAVLASASAAAQTRPPALSGYVALVSDYRLRGLSQTEGQEALQLGIDYQQASGFFVGARASNVDYPGARRVGRKIEADAYAGFNRSHGAWSWTVTATRYAYPGSGAGYDYGEVGGTFGFADRLYYTAAWTDDLYGEGDSALDQQLGLSWPLARGFEASGTLGRFASDYVLGGAYTYWDVGISKRVGRVSLDLRHYENNYDDAYSYLGEPAGDRWVVSIAYGWLTRP